jgi:integrase
MYLRSGTYYFADPGGKWHNLGRDYAAAMYGYAQITGPGGHCRTLADAVDRYMREVACKNAERTYKDKLHHGKIIKKAMGNVRPQVISPQAVYKFRDIISKNGKVQANRTVGTLSHIFTSCIEWGLVTSNPCQQVKRFKEYPRDRYVEDWEFEAFGKFAGEQIAAYMEFKYLTGLRKGDILNMSRDQIKPDGIYIQTSKTGKKMIIERTPALDASIARINKLRKVISIYLFSTRTGGKYTVSGFTAIWQRKMVKALKQGVITERFTEHDLRAKTASDTDLKHAASLLTHDDIKTTQKHYRRKAERVRPLQ